MLDLDTLVEIRKTLAALSETEALLAQADRNARAHYDHLTVSDRDQLCSLIVQSNAHHQALVESVKALTELAQRMIDQRQSVKEAYHQGWNARLKDLVDQLTEEEYAQLRRVLQQIQHGQR